MKAKLANYFSGKGDIRNYEFLNSIFKEFLVLKKPINSVIHLAGLKSVGDSMIDPLNYWDVNVNGTINLLSVMQKNNCHNIALAVVPQYTNQK